MFSSRTAFVAATLALGIASANAACVPGQNFDPVDGSQCEAAQKARGTTNEATIAIKNGNVVATSSSEAGSIESNLSDMQSAKVASKMFADLNVTLAGVGVTIADVGVKARRADKTVAELVQELVEKNTAQNTIFTSLVSEVKAMASNAGVAPCIPYVEWTDPKDKVCKPLSMECKNVPGTWEKTTPLRNRDRICAKHTACSLGKTYQTVAPTVYNDRKCTPVAAICDIKKTMVEIQAPTLTSDRKCIGLGMIQAKPAKSCLIIKEGLKENAKSGYYWIQPTGTNNRRTYCDMTSDGGGWTMIGRAKGGQQSCWRTSGDCTYQSLGDPKYRWQDGNTAHMSDSWISKLVYKRIKFSGSGRIKRSYFWKGKDDGGCNYRHATDANGACNCASQNVNLGSLRCGRSHYTHEGVGDWPNSGALHSNHHSNWWYIKHNAGSSGSASSSTGYCYGRQGDCHVQLWVR